ncbi:MAG: DUF402 domain-containing protein [Gemmatimonadota bacterium]|nr:DUF402 domain-containing protein [Gemmatimonadota bacterium]
MTYREIKRHLDKPDAVFDCDPVVRARDYVVLKYLNARSGRVGRLEIPAGSVTYGYYRHGAGYVLWKMCDPEGRLLGHLFHICRNLKVGDHHVDYVDLMLDLWFDPSGRLTVLDRDELETFRQREGLSRRDMEWIARQERTIACRFAGILEDFDGILARAHAGSIPG